MMGIGIEMQIGIEMGDGNGDGNGDKLCADNNVISISSSSAMKFSNTFYAGALCVYIKMCLPLHDFHSAGGLS